MNKIIFILALMCQFNAYGQSKIDPRNCTDCWNFVAPSVLGSENVSPAEVGLITYDTNSNKFRGYSSNGDWVALSNNLNIANISSTSTLDISDAEDLILIDSSSASVTLNLPTAIGNIGKAYTIKKTSTDGSDVVVDPNGSENIEGMSTTTLAFGDILKIVSDGSNWQVYNRVKNRIETKTLSADISSSGTISELTCSNLIVGKWYEITGQFAIQLDASSADDSALVEAIHDSNEVAEFLFQVQEGDSNSDILKWSFSFKFKATSNSLTFNAVSVSANSKILANGDRDFTYIQIEERNDLIETTAF